MKRFFRLSILALLVVALTWVMAGGLARAMADTPQDTSGGTDTQLSPGVTPTQQNEQATQKVFFYKDGQLQGVDREVTGGAQVAGFTISELLKGPTDEEKAQGYSTQIPDGVKMLYYTESNDGKTFGTDVSTEMTALQGDAERAAKALDQVVKTAQAVSGAENVNVTIGGEDAWQVLGISRGGSASEGSNLWWIILVIVLGGLTLSGTSLMLFAIRRGAAHEVPEKQSNPIKSTARKSLKVSRTTSKKRRLPFLRKDGKR